MTEKEKFDILIDKGYYYDENLGQIITPRGIVLEKNKTGYIHISTTHNYKRINILTHRLIWYIKTGTLPGKKIDHINKIKNDNRFENLRDITQSENCWNTDAKGYCFIKNRKGTGGRYRATITINYKTINLGSYQTELEARQAYLDAKSKYHIL